VKEVLVAESWPALLTKLVVKTVIWWLPFIVVLAIFSWGHPYPLGVGVIRGRISARSCPTET
jgi:hypothetical protein